MEVEAAAVNSENSPGPAPPTNPFCSVGQQFGAENIPFMPTDESGCRRSQSSHTLEEIYDSLNEDQRCRKLDSVDSARVCPVTTRIQLLTKKTNIGKNFGYTAGGKIYLCPEEALYFLEIHKLQIFVGNVSISIQRARSLFLNPINDKEGHVFDGRTCGFDEYTVFKYLAQQGYRPRRPNHILCEVEKAILAYGKVDLKEEQDVDMETDSPKSSFKSTGETEPQVSPLSEAKLGKRKVPEDEPPSPEKKAKLYRIDEEMENGHSPEGSPDVILVEKTSTSPEAKRDPHTVLLESSPSSSPSSSSGSDEPIPSTSRGIDSYTVTEVDSDVEFVEEVFPTGVQIEEISSTQNIEESDEELPDIDECSNKNDNFASTSTARPPQARESPHVLVDLVSSDDEDESEGNLRKFSNKVWSQLTPHSTAKFGLPPGELLPEGISRPDRSRSAHDISEEPCDLDLEEILVEGLRIDNDSRYAPNRNQAKSWNDWRNQQATQSFNVFSNSLFGSYTGDSQPPTVQKLNLWATEPQAGSSRQEVLRQQFLRKYKFDLYPPTENKLARSRLEKPAYRVIIVRERETMPSLDALTYPEDQVPFLIAVVNEDQDVSFLLPGNSAGIPNLFTKS